MCRDQDSCCGPMHQQEPPPCKTECTDPKTGYRYRCHSMCINPPGTGAGMTTEVDNCTVCGAQNNSVWAQTKSDRRSTFEVIQSIEGLLAAVREKPYSLATERRHKIILAERAMSAIFPQEERESHDQALP